jgi:very-short-patch-repair endonuclease/predicted transcriptional regulator of viral defense system
MAVPSGHAKTFTVDTRIRDLAERQHGVVSRVQLLELGVTAGQIARRLRNERLRHVRRGVYALGHRAIGQKGVWMSAVLLGGSGAALSRRSAAQLWGLGSWRGPVEIVCLEGARLGRARSSGDLPPPSISRARHLRPHDVTRLDDIPVTTVARTLVDLAGVLEHRRLSVVLNEAELTGTLDLAHLRRGISEGAGRRGIQRLRSLVDELHPLARDARSILEIEFLSMVDRLNFPPPQINVVVSGFLVDAYWQEWGLIVELDSRGFHDTAKRFEDDRERSAQLELAGLRVLRLTWTMVTHRPRETERKLLAFRGLLEDPSTDKSCRRHRR